MIISRIEIFELTSRLKGVMGSLIRKKKLIHCCRKEQLLKPLHRKHSLNMAQLPDV